VIIEANAITLKVQTKAGVCDDEEPILPFAVSVGGWGY
jgi:hypothetical protein